MHYTRNILTDLMIDLRNTHYEYDVAGNLIKDGKNNVAMAEVNINEIEQNIFFAHSRIEVIHNGNVRVIPKDGY